MKRAPKVECEPVESLENSNNVPEQAKQYHRADPPVKAGPSAAIEGSCKRPVDTVAAARQVRLRDNEPASGRSEIVNMRKKTQVRNDRSQGGARSVAPHRSHGEEIYKAAAQNPLPLCDTSQLIDRLRNRSVGPPHHSSFAWHIAITREPRIERARGAASVRSSRAGLFHTAGRLFDQGGDSVGVARRRSRGCPAPRRRWRRRASP